MRKYLKGPLLGEPPEHSSQSSYLLIDGLLNLIRAWSVELVHDTKTKISERSEHIILMFSDKWTQLHRTFQESLMEIWNARDAGRIEDYFNNQFLRGKLKRPSITQACGIRCKWKYWVKGIDFATVQFIPKTTTMCNSDAHFSKSLSFLVDSCTKGIKIWKASHKSVSQGTTACLSWAG